MTASAIYIASPEGDTGKSTIALGILHKLTATVARVAVFRPITRLEHREAAPSPGSPGDAEGERDYILELLLSQATAGLTYQECAGVSYRQLHEDPEAAIAEIVERFHRVARG